jgi:hypothetical protein
MAQASKIETSYRIVSQAICYSGISAYWEQVCRTASIAQDWFLFERCGSNGQLHTKDFNGMSAFYHVTKGYNKPLGTHIFSLGGRHNLIGGEMRRRSEKRL